MSRDFHFPPQDLASLSSACFADLHAQWVGLGCPEAITIRGESTLLRDLPTLTVHAAPDDWDKPGAGHLWTYAYAVSYGFGKKTPPEHPLTSRQLTRVLYGFAPYVLVQGSWPHDTLPFATLEDGSIVDLKVPFTIEFPSANNRAPIEVDGSIRDCSDYLANLPKATVTLPCFVGAQRCWDEDIHWVKDAEGFWCRTVALEEQE